MSNEKTEIISTKAIDKKLDKSKKQKKTQQKAEAQEIKSEAQLQTFMQKEIIKETDPATKMIFGMINDVLKKYHVNPFSDKEINEIAYFINEKAFGGRPPDMLENAQDKALNIRIVIFVLTAIIPRIYNFIKNFKLPPAFTKKKSQTDDVLSGGYEPV